MAEDVSLTETTVISGTYAGTVAITEPVALGVLDMAFRITDTHGVLTGTVQVTRTLAYSSATALQGSITGSIDGITPTFRVDSEDFGGVVSGREVERSFTLVGEALEDGEILQGQYTEVITGFTPKPLTVEGLFLVTRPSQALGSETPPGTPEPTNTPGPTPTATVVPTYTPTPEFRHLIYLPVVSRHGP